MSVASATWRHTLRVLGLATLALTWACSEPVLSGWTEEELAVIESLSPIPELPPAPTNWVADNLAAAHLGQRIFFDARFSSDGSVSCATCHKPQLYFTDGQARAVGVAASHRHTQSIVGAQWQPFLFWDGRKDSLWSQALAPFEGQLEHDITRLEVVHRVALRYRSEYVQIFGQLPPFEDGARFPAAAMPVEGQPEDPRSVAWAAMAPADRDAVNEVYANVGKSIAAYERRLVPEPGNFDRYVGALAAGDETGGGNLSDLAVRGLRFFIGEASCVNCHNGPLFSDRAFHNVGLPNVIANPDTGRALGARQVLDDPFNTSGEFSDAGVSDDLRFLNPDFDDFEGAFRTPSLRNVAATAPYGHAGQFASLEELLAFYQELPRVPMTGHRDMILKLLGNALEVDAMIAFLESLTGPLPDQQWLGAPPE